MVPAVASHTYTLLGAVTEGCTKTDDQTCSVVLHSKIHNDARTQTNSVQTTGQVICVDHGKCQANYGLLMATSHCGEYCFYFSCLYSLSLLQ